MSSCCGHKYKQQKLRNSNKKTYLAPSLSSSATTMTTGIGRWWLGPAGLPLTQFPHSSCCCYRNCGPCPRCCVVAGQPGQVSFFKFPSVVGAERVLCGIVDVSSIIRSHDSMRRNENFFKSTLVHHGDLAHDLVRAQPCKHRYIRPNTASSYHDQYTLSIFS